MSMTFESWLHGQWAERGAFAWALSPLSLLFMAISRARMRRIKPVEIPVPVVVVGNIYVGGTGRDTHHDPTGPRITQCRVDSGCCQPRLWTKELRSKASHTAIPCL